MVLSQSNTDMEIPDLNAEAYAGSVDCLSFLEKFGRKWYAAGVQAGLAQAREEAEDRPEVTTTPRSQEDQILIASLVTCNEEMEKKMKGKEKDVESFKAVAIDAQERIMSAHAAVVSIRESAIGVAPYWLSDRLTSVVSELHDRVNECRARIDKACRDSKKRAREFEGPNGGSNKHRKHNGNAFD
ncbi:hypothetical protein FLAG1_09990 [Fusarium langsethiae]|uniref:Uncharacterized protein n=1 Tax=Fusarium langsethiae TaxID=179993 RepID=A0A0M9EPE3_FUSLA|nr:hypothetical protein FLAG1_09990 [Fusarium langsethiae]GKU07000.1 unnamed protein product [Fusarium langsethiae]GKU22766.1 unnamed protein product [Fusarium langsethiae]